MEINPNLYAGAIGIASREEVAKKIVSEVVVLLPYDGADANMGPAKTAVSTDTRANLIP